MHKHKLASILVVSLLNFGLSTLTGIALASETEGSLFDGATSDPELNNAVSSGAANQHAGAGRSGTGLIDDYNAKKPLQGNVTFRICYYDLGDAAEAGWEALRDANYLQGRGKTVSLILDRGGVRLADSRNQQAFQLHSGSTEQMVSTQTLLRQFVENGGKVYASQRWCEQFGLTVANSNRLTAGVTLLGDEDLADLVFESNVIDYTAHAGVTGMKPKKTTPTGGSSMAGGCK